MKTITRAKLQEHIELGIMAGRPHGLADADVEALRAVGATAQTVAVGTCRTFDEDTATDVRCPLSQAGLWARGVELPQRQFYRAFDDSFPGGLIQALRVVG